MYIHVYKYCEMYVRVHTFQHIYVHVCTRGVSIPELKMSTNLKMHLKPSVQDVWQNLDSGSTL